MAEGPAELVDRLLGATNGHDLDALVSCFAEDFVNETPVHPARGFVGRVQVRKNWAQIFAFVPDLTAEVIGRAVTGTSVWTEWRMRGTRRDGSEHRMAGIIVFEVDAGVAKRARFFLEPVDDTDATVDEAVQRQVVR